MRSATRIAVSTFGTLAGLAGLEHGIGEMLQGNIAPGAIVIESWPTSEFFRIWDGEPAMTIVPNLLVSGILTVLLALAFLVWVTMFVQKNNGGPVLILLSISLLLVGGGFGPPILGVILGVAATRINAPTAWWHPHLSFGLRQVLERGWFWLYSICLLAWLMLFPGLGILSYYFGLNDSNIVFANVLLALGTLLLTLVVGVIRDSQRQTDSPRAAVVARA